MRDSTSANKFVESYYNTHAEGGRQSIEEVKIK
jgi:hypothetical protein